VKVTRRAAVAAVLSFLFFLLTTALAWAWVPKPISIFEGGRFGLPPVEFLEDPSTHLTVADVVNRQPDFKPLDRVNHGYTSSAFWVRMAIANPSKSPDTAIIEFSATALHTDLYDVTDPAEPKLVATSGADLAFRTRPVQHVNVAFRVSLAAEETRTFVVRVAGKDTLILDPAVWREDTFWNHVTRGRILDGIYYGIILGLAFYNLFLAFATRDKAYLAYVAFQLSMALFNLAVDKYSFQYLWPNSPTWAARSEQVFNMLVLSAAMLCGRMLLDTRTHAPRMNVALRWIGIVMLGWAPACALFDPPALVMFTLATIAFVGITMLVIAAAIVARGGSAHGYIFLSAWAILFIGSFLAALASIGVLESFAGYDLLKVGSALEATLLSFGLAVRIRVIQRERAQAREELLTERSRRIDSLSRLVAGVAHEIGNPLNFAKGGADALGPMLESIANEKKQSSAKRALGLVESGLDRIRRMLVHLRSDLGDREAQKTSVAIDSEIDQALEMLSLTERKVEVKREGEKGLKVLARAGDPAQVFGNLARNAADAMAAKSGDGGGMLEITVKSEGEEVVIRFRDDGPGVPEDLRATIFEPFFTTRQNDGGTGLGLFVSREIIARWGGTLTLETGEENGGACFVVRLPKDRGGSLS
jgi:two-component system, NtrC family, sensor kinase